MGAPAAIVVRLQGRRADFVLDGHVTSNAELLTRAAGWSPERTNSALPQLTIEPLCPAHHGLNACVQRALRMRITLKPIPIVSTLAERRERSPCASLAIYESAADRKRSQTNCDSSRDNRSRR